MRRAKAFCPGHVTGFFEICRRRRLLATGSRGAGMCLTLGAFSEVEVADASRQSVHIEIAGRSARAEVTRAAVARLLGKRKLRVHVATTLQLPVSQGFSMSAAGALSSTIALAKILGETRQHAFEAAHMAEINCGGGLGDVPALHKGGITVREEPGLPPLGVVHRIGGAPDVVLAVVGPMIRTKSVLEDPAMSSAINRSGANMVRLLLKRRSLQTLMSLSSSFALDTGLASDAVARAIKSASEYGCASMSMLGNSVFAIGNRDGLRKKLSAVGKVYVCSVDVTGPRLV